ncbi:MAG: ribbon-helix-helix domain-containing protein [Cyanobacteria bacterium J06607_15]
MATKSINVTIDEKLLSQSDLFISQGKYPNRSQFVQASIKNMLAKLDAEYIAEQVKLLKNDLDTESWFGGELADWQEKY